MFDPVAGAHFDYHPEIQNAVFSFPWADLPVTQRLRYFLDH